MGNHFTLDFNIFYNDVTLFDIGIKNNTNLYLIKLSSPIKNIDINKTINANINFPFEQEIFLKNLNGIKILDISQFKINNK